VKKNKRKSNDDGENEEDANCDESIVGNEEAKRKDQ